MQISRIEIRNFRKLPHRLIEGLGPGLNVIVGDNEAGKSTVLAALRAALFERHRLSGEHARAMQPYGQAVRPEVEVDFALQGEAYRLRKAFVQKPEALLIGRARQWANDEADEELARLLGFTPPGRGETKPEEHHGIFGLLWVEQGAAHRYPRVPGMQGQVSSALEQEIGEVTGGERGRRLLAAAELRFGKHWTSKGLARGRVKDLTAALEQRVATRADLIAQLGDLDDKVDRLAQVDAALGRHRETKSLETAREAMAMAEQAARALEGAQLKVRTAQLERDTALTRHGAADKALADRAQLRAAIARLETGVEAAAALAKQREDELLQRGRLVADGRRQLDDALVAEAAASAESSSAAAAERAARLAAEIARETQALAEADRADAERQAAEVTIAGLAITPEQIAMLEKRATELGIAQHRLAAASVRLRLMPAGMGRLTIDGAAPAATEITLSADALLEIEGYGRIEVEPGGGVAELRDAVAVAERRHADLLAGLGVADIAAARTRLEQRKAAEAKRAEARRVLAMLAPDGLAALRDELGLRRAELAALPAQALEGKGDVSALKQAHEAARASREQAERTLKRLEDQLSALRPEAAVAADRLIQAQQALDNRRAELSVAEAGRGDDALAAEAALCAETLARATTRLAEAEAEFASADPEATRLKLLRANAAVKNIEEDIGRLDTERLRLEAALAALGQRGLGEQLAECEGEIARMERQLATELHEAQAAKLLFETLSTAQKESKERWLAPVKAAVTPYLRLLAPDGSVVLNEDTLELSEVVRNGVSEPFSNLSMGAREQVAVITRLALADLLREAGQPSTVLLDDALVNTDAERLDRMHLVLHKAAEKQQIIVLTCRERDFLGLGAPIFRL